MRSHPLISTVKYKVSLLWRLSQTFNMELLFLPFTRLFLPFGVYITVDIDLRPVSVLRFSYITAEVVSK